MNQFITELDVERDDQPLTAVAACHDRLVTGYLDGSIAVWKAHYCGPDIKKYLVSEFGGRRCSAVSSVVAAWGFVFSGHEDATIRQWDLQTGEKIRSLRNSEGTESTRLFTAPNSLV